MEVSVGKVKFRKKSVETPVTAALAQVSIEVSPIKYHRAHEDNGYRENISVQSSVNEGTSQLSEVYSPAPVKVDNSFAEAGSFYARERTVEAVLPTSFPSNTSVSSEYSRYYTPIYSDLTPVVDRKPTSQYSHNLGSQSYIGSNIDNNTYNTTPSPQPRQMNERLLSVDNVYTKPTIASDSFDYTSMSLATLPTTNTVRNCENGPSLTVPSDDIHIKITNTLHSLTSQINDSIKRSQNIKASIRQIDNAIDDEISRFLHS